MKRWLVIGALTAALAGCGPDESVPFNPNAAADCGARLILRDAFVAVATKPPQDEGLIFSPMSSS